TGGKSVGRPPLSREAEPVPCLRSHARAFPENRENNREISKISGHFDAFRGFGCPFALQFQCAAAGSLFRAEQGICWRRTGNFSPEQVISYRNPFHRLDSCE